MCTQFFHVASMVFLPKRFKNLMFFWLHCVVLWYMSLCHAFQPCVFRGCCACCFDLAFVLFPTAFNLKETKRKFLNCFGNQHESNIPPTSINKDCEPLKEKTMQQNLGITKPKNMKATYMRTTCWNVLDKKLHATSTFTKTWKNTKFWKPSGQERGHNTIAIPSLWDVLKKQHARNMNEPWAKPRKIATLKRFWKATWRKDGSNMRNNLGQHKLLKRIWKKHGCNMKETCEWCLKFWHYIFCDAFARGSIHVHDVVIEDMFQEKQTASGGLQCLQEIESKEIKYFISECVEICDPRFVNSLCDQVLDTGKQHERNMQATCGENGENIRFWKRFGKQQGRNMQATCEKTTEKKSWNVLKSNMNATCNQHAQILGKHQVLEPFWKPTWTHFESNMRKNLEKHQVIETFLKATWTQHGSSMRKNLGNTRFFKHSGKQHGRNECRMCKNLGKHQVLETFWQPTWTEHESNTRKHLGKGRVFETFWKATWTEHAQKPRKTPGSWNVLESNMDATCSKTRENTSFCKRFGKQHGHNMTAARAKTWDSTIVVSGAPPPRRHPSTIPAVPGSLPTTTWHRTAFLSRLRCGVDAALSD